ncbi:hypothetical protein MUA33_08890 [Staphylococcus delphini]|uniref:hypothetical protein n=1 Tax=Staphylococcus delphini TaxID=53344 RepID=UPI0021CE88BA|nr:hypothetical protein [Staphylococcus delphini]UXS28598.1 hypothetical protein MUA33_08890 [Staphylococcus delphini]
MFTSSHFFLYRQMLLFCAELSFSFLNMMFFFHGTSSFVLEHVACLRLPSLSFFEHVACLRLPSLSFFEHVACLRLPSLSFLNMLLAYDCRLGLAFPGAEPPTNQRFDDTVTLVEALVDFPVQLIPRESRPSGNLARTEARKESSPVQSTQLTSSKQLLRQTLDRMKVNSFLFEFMHAFPRESRPSGNLARTEARKESSPVQSTQLTSSKQLLRQTLDRMNLIASCSNLSTFFSGVSPILATLHKQK